MTTESDLSAARTESARLSDLLRREHHAMAEFLVALAIFDEQRRWDALGYGSLFDYLHRKLGLPKSAAFYRMTAAHLVQQYPAAVEPFRAGKLCLSTLAELSKVLTLDNVGDVLPRFFGLSKREAQAVAAELQPADVVPRRTVVTPISPRRSEPATPALRLTQADAGQPVLPANRTPREVPPAPAPAPTFLVEPKTAELNRVHLTVPRRLLEKLERARDALSHSHHGASEAEILEVGLDLILERQAKRRGLVKTPRTPREKTPAVPTVRGEPVDPGGRSPRAHIPAAVRRAVWLRDGGRCQHPLDSGGVCGSTFQVEIDHIDPSTKDRAPTAEELQLACRGHNDSHAREAYGDDLMNNYTRPKGGACSEPVAIYRASTRRSGCAGRFHGIALRSRDAAPLPSALAVSSL
jgi:5-methylcytosine-specific restriction endonuclease McrA